jgi:hypothetical protein
MAVSPSFLLYIYSQSSSCVSPTAPILGTFALTRTTPTITPPPPPKKKKKEANDFRVPNACITSTTNSFPFKIIHRH